MRSCCDVFPPAFARVRSGARSMLLPGEHGVVDWARVPIRNGSIIYVPSLDVPVFIRRFATLPGGTRITLVSGGEDVGLPRELFGVGVGARTGMQAPIRHNLDDFVGDDRLLRWWVQNYDLTGCNAYSGCPPATKSRRHAQLVRKLRPLPIGLDFHTLGEKAAPKRAISPCAQHAELERIRAELPGFDKRPSSLLAPFACARPDRAPVCAALCHLNGSARAAITFWLGDRADLWRSFGSHAFVATPWGHGVDTHRLWEVLALGSVPVVVSSSLDTALYADFPVICIGAWTEADASAMTGWRARIAARFGSEPFGATVREKLTSAYWAGQIAAQHRRDLGVPPESEK